MKQLKSIQVPKQSHMLDKFSSERSIYSDRNFFLNQYRTINRLLKLNYTYYYKFNYNLFNFIKKTIKLNFWRFYLLPLNTFRVFTPFYKFGAQIQLKHNTFSLLLSTKTDLKTLFILNKKFFSSTQNLSLKSKKLVNKLPGGLNSIFFTKNNKQVVEDLSLSSFNSVINSKHLITISPSNHCFSSFLSTINIIFYISLSNYMLMYKFFIWNILVRL